MNKIFTEEVWAIVDENDKVLWSRGGSSSKQHLLVYPNEKAAERGLSNSWTKQQVKVGKVKRIY